MMSFVKQVVAGCVVAVLLSSAALAQEALPTGDILTPEAAPTAPAEPALQIRNYNPRDYVPLSALLPDGSSVQVTDEVVFQSLLFTPDEINTVISTLNRRARSPASSNVGSGFIGGPLAIPGQEIDEESAAAKPYYPPIPTKRVISVSGMIYRKPGDWIVWINGHKLVPGARLPELVDIKVERDRVHLKWFDIGMAKILTITLRPRQTYDITSGVLLNTTGGEIQ